MTEKKLWGPILGRDTGTPMPDRSKSRSWTNGPPGWGLSGPGFELTGGLVGLTPQFPRSFHCDPQPLSSCYVADPPSSFFTIRTLVRTLTATKWITETLLRISTFDLCIWSRFMSPIWIYDHYHGLTLCPQSRLPKFSHLICTLIDLCLGTSADIARWSIQTR